jgi:hypothetical protein
MSHGSNNTPIPVGWSIFCGSMAGSVAEVKILLNIRSSLSPSTLLRLDSKFKVQKKQNWEKPTRPNIMECSTV